MKPIGRISGAVTDQQKRRTFATLGEAAEGLRATTDPLCGLGAREKNVGHDFLSEKWPVHLAIKRTGLGFTHYLVRRRTK
ncbi:MULTISPECIES: hypothetical protein [unclassified Bradyrhizobium]|uniref:hypothetical protein n=1 Tax=unclassified Bradyrhizobium TaxID=2631580 RepID=UPI001046191A|nr:MULTISPECIES: hypothetical protein [unclassified Bradyrhizobium]